MGAIITGIVGEAASFGLSELDTVLIKTQRSIAGVFPDVTIEEVHTDELEITQHPVEGAFISDNAFKKPVRLLMRVGWSDSSSAAEFALNLVGLSDFSPPTILDTYQKLQNIQSVRLPFTVVTGKRMYNNMLMASLRCTTNVESENSLMVECEFQEVIIVQTQSATLPPMAVQATPEKTAETVNNGTVQPKQVNSSLLNTAFGSNSPFSTPVAPPFQ